MDYKIRHSPEKITREFLKQFVDLNKQLEEIRTNKIKGTILRSKAKWIVEGEKATQYFLNLENRNFVSKLIPKLKLENGREINNTLDILDEQRKFYSTLYSEEIVDENAINDILHNLDFPKLDTSKSDQLEGLITYEELTNTLKSFKTGKSPGLDGYTAEFLKFFWRDLEYLFCVLLIMPINKVKCRLHREGGSLLVFQNRGNQNF